jgi:hypothetical protein
LAFLITNAELFGPIPAIGSRKSPRKIKDRTKQTLADTLV